MKVSTKFDSLKRQIFLNKYYYRFRLGKKGLVMKYYIQNQGYSYDFDNPVTFTEKINTRKLDKNPLFTLCADKIRVRKYVKKKIGKKYLIPCYFKAKKLTSKLYDSMPKSCVLKTASGSGTIKIIYDKSKENKKEILSLMKEYQKIDFAYVWGELFYKKIKNNIICEKLLLDKNGNIPNDYKIHCFNNGGKQKCLVQIEFDRFGDHRRNIYDSKFNLLDLTTGLKKYNGIVEKPKNWRKMIKIAKKLSEDFEYVRVDLYNINGKIYFGELTFTHSAGFSHFNPEKYNRLWGKYWGRV